MKQENETKQNNKESLTSSGSKLSQEARNNLADYLNCLIDIQKQFGDD